MTNYGTLKLIRHFCEQVFAIHDCHQSNFSQFEKEPEYQLSVCMCLIQIGELANSLTEDFQEVYVEIPWDQLRCFRNRLAHQYGSIDVDLSYQISTVDIKSIYEKICTMIQQFEEKYPQVKNHVEND